MVDFFRMINLVPLRLSHATVLSTASKHPEFLKGLLYDAPLTRAEATADIKRMLARMKKREAIVRSIERDGEIIGRIGAGLRGNRWFLFYWIVPEHQEKGYGSKAVESFLPLAPRPLYIEVHPWNAASKKIVRNAGGKKHSDVYRLD